MDTPKENIKHYDLTKYQTLTLAIISDTHGEIDKQVLTIVNQSDIALHVGDIMGNKVLEKLNPKLGIIIPVRGNNDLIHTWDKSEHPALAKIPDTAIINTQSGIIAMEHGHKINHIDFDQSALGYKYPDARLVIYGHTHKQKLDDSTMPWLLNPGVAGVTRNDGGASCYQLKIFDIGWGLQKYKFSTRMLA